MHQPAPTSRDPEPAARRREAAAPPTTAGPEARPKEVQLGSLHEFWSVLMRRKFTVAAVFMVVTLIVGGGSLLIPPSYTAQAAIMVKHGREFFYRAPSGSSDDGTIFSLQEMVNSEVEILTSLDLSALVLRELELERIYPDMLEDPEADRDMVFAAAVTRFRDSFVIMDVPESSIIRITFEHGNRMVAADALNLFIERFLDKHLEVFSEPKAGFITEQLASYEARLVESEGNLTAFRREYGIYNLPEQNTLLLNQHGALDTELNTVSFRISELEQRLSMLNGRAASAERPKTPPSPTEDRESLVKRRGALGIEMQEIEMRLAEIQQHLLIIRDRERVGSDTIAPPPGTDRVRSLDEAFVRLLDLQLREKELLRIFDERNRQVIGVREEIEVVKQFLRMRGAYVNDTIEAQYRDELEGLVARRAAASDQIENVDAMIRAFDVRVTLDELAPLEARRTRISQELAEVQDEIRGLHENEREYRRLERRVLLDDRNYQTFVEVAEEARIMEELDRQKMANITVIERATPPVRPSGLPPKLRVVLGAFVGLFAGVAAAIFLELAETTPRGLDETRPARRREAAT